MLSQHIRRREMKASYSRGGLVYEGPGVLLDIGELGDTLVRGLAPLDNLSHRLTLLEIQK